MAKSILQSLLSKMIKSVLEARFLKSKNISNDQELIQSDPISCPQTGVQN